MSARRQFPTAIVVADNPGTMNAVTFRLAHISDTHIGYESYKALSAGGENQRGVDVAKAFVSAVSDIVAANPPLVIHSGDLADRTIIPIRLILLIRQQLQRLASIRPDGSRRQVLIIAGNHEIPRNRKEACFLHLFDGLPGVHVVTRDYEQVTFPATGTSENCDPVLRDVVVHALPHDALKTVDFDSVRPVDEKVNVLTAHGVAGGSELYLRSLGREFTIPTEVLSRGWSYGALGHWHKQGPVPLVATGSTSEDSGVVWYAGSTENMGFGDLRENGTRRGWLSVTVRPNDRPIVERKYVPIRAMIRLPLVDGAGLDPAQITEVLIERIRAENLSGAVAGQIVQGVARDVWSLVDLARVRAAAGDCLHYEVSLRVRPIAGTPADKPGQTGASRGLTGVDTVLEEVALSLLNDNERAGGLALARELLTAELERTGQPAAEPVTDAGTTAATEAITESATPGKVL